MVVHTITHLFGHTFESEIEIAHHRLQRFRLSVSIENAENRTHTYRHHDKENRECSHKLNEGEAFIGISWALVSHFIGQRSDRSRRPQYSVCSPPNF